MRNKRIDIIKGFGIALVVLAHTQLSAERVINLFHVGLFFIASGYCFSESSTDTFQSLVSYLKKCVLRLYVPFVLFNGAFLVLHNLFCAVGIYAGAAMSAGQLLEQMGKILLMVAGEELVGPCWFLRALLVLRTVFAVIDFVCKKIAPKRIWLLRAVISLGFLLAGGWLNRHDIVLKYDFSTVCSVYCLYVFGLLLKKVYKSGKGNAFLLSGKTNAACLILGTVALLVLSRFGPIAYNANEYPNVVIFLAGAAAGWSVCWALAGLVERIPACSKVFCFLGERTLSIMLLHLSGFKLVTLAYVLLNRLDRSSLSAFPVLNVQWWPAYFAAGVLFPIILDCIWDQAVAVVRRKKWLQKPGAIAAGVLIVAVLCAAVLFLGSRRGYSWDYIDYSTLDYSLIYDEEYYLKKNPDVAEAYAGKSSEEIFKHFQEHGMKEGRIASEQFNAAYYRSQYSDLDALFGDDWEKYYAHYVMCGAAENRAAAYDDGSSDFVDTEVMCRLNEAGEVVLEFEAAEELLGQSFAVYELMPFEEECAGREPVYQGILEAENTVCVPFTDVTSKYAIADANGEILFGGVYVTNPELLCQSPAQLPAVSSKKGIQLSESQDMDTLKPSYIFVNMFMNEFIELEDGEDVIVYQYGGQEYYFNRAAVEGRDALFSAMTGQGIRVCASILLRYDETLPFLYYPDAYSESAAFYGINTSQEEGVNYLKAFVSFMSERYDGNDPDKGMITKWMVGNEVNDSVIYNSVGTMERQDYIREYGRTFRIVYNIVKSNIPAADVYMVMEPWWGIHDKEMIFGGERFLNIFNAYIRSEGNIDWGLAYHAYSFPLSDPKVLNDDEAAVADDGVSVTGPGYYTVDDASSLTITMENIDVLTEYMHRDALLTDEGEVRSIILSEQGYTSNSPVYGTCEAEQAASMLFAYYKAEMQEDIDAFIYFLQIDDDAASMGNTYYRFGLSSRTEDGQLDHKLSYDVFRVMDTKDSLTMLNGMLEILNLSDWTDEIPYFDSDRFAAMRELESREERIDISDAVISPIPDQTSTGRECLPEVTVTLDGQVLEHDVDYDVVYQNNTAPGEATVIIVGLNEYDGMVKASFTVR